MQTGDLQSLRWLRSRLGDAGLREWIVGQNARGLSPRQIRYWALILDIESALADEWVKTASASNWEQRCYPPLQPCNNWPEGNCNLAYLDDLACMKLAAVTQRGSRKDFVDIYELAQRHKPLIDLLGLFQKKYEMENLAPVLMGLVYFEDAESETDPFMWSGNWQEVKRAISEWVRRI
jgi:hypothetical protein